jgi:hypothetical protein
MAIIGISGKSQSGKDTVGKIIQYLIYVNENRISDNEFILSLLSDKNLDNRLLEQHCNWQIKKFAYKLKQCVSIITGIPVEDLEKEELKNINLTDCWKITTDASNIHNKYKSLGGYGIFIGNESQDQIDRETNIRKELDNWIEENKTPMTVRRLLQLLCTEVGRAIHPNFWINALFIDYNPQEIFKGIVFIKADDSKEFVESKLSYPNWIITDVRFPNELQAIKDRDGITIRVEKFIDKPSISIDDDFNLCFSNNEIITEHESETSLDNATFDYTINAKQGDISSLIEQTKQILIKEKLL